MKSKDFNVRIVVDEKGEVNLGFVQGFYKTPKGTIIQDVPEKVRESLAKRLNAKLLAKIPSQMKDLKP